MNKHRDDTDAHLVKATWHLAIWTKRLAVATIVSTLAIIIITIILDNRRESADKDRDLSWHEMDAARASVQLVADLNKDLAAFRKPLKDAFPEMYRTTMNDRPISMQEAEAIYQGCDANPKSELCIKKGAANDYLNFLEQISLSYNLGLVKKEVMSELFSQMIVDDFAYLYNFVRVVEQHKYGNKRKAWPLLQNFVHDTKQSTAQ